MAPGPDFDIPDLVCHAILMNRYKICNWERSFSLNKLKLQGGPAAYNEENVFFFTFWICQGWHFWGYLWWIAIKRCSVLRKSPKPLHNPDHTLGKCCYWWQIPNNLRQIITPVQQWLRYTVGEHSNSVSAQQVQCSPIINNECYPIAFLLLASHLQNTHSRKEVNKQKQKHSYSVSTCLGRGE